jgi:hypothetical protein
MEQEGMRVLVKKGMLESIENLKATLKECKKALRDFESGKSPMSYRVFLRSLWRDYDEKDVKIRHDGPLDAAVKAAENKFRRVNHRSDVQASYSVCIIVNNLVVYQVPDKMVEKVKERA